MITEDTLRKIISESIERVINQDFGNNKIARPARKASINEVTEHDLTLYHGTPHSFIKFNTKNIGNGEGNQSFGYGLYFTSVKGVAEFYANLLKNPVGYIYTVNVNGGEFFEWNKKLDTGFKRLFVEKMNDNGYNEMPYIRRFENGNIKTYSMSVEDAVNYFPNGKFFYENVSLLLGGDKKASEFLSEMGFVGIKYPVGSFFKRNISSGEYNYVIFNGNDVEVIKKEMIN